MLIKVTNKHIDLANNWRNNPMRNGCSGEECPIAQAIVEVTKKVAWVRDFIITVRSPNAWQTGEASKSYRVSKRMRAFIKKYDSNKPVKPFNFILKEKVCG